MNLNFRTSFKPLTTSIALNHQQPILLLGSCFSNNVGKKLEEAKFNVVSNPFGISYNPISIHKLLNPNFTFSAKENNGIYYSHDFHSDLNELSSEIFHLQVKEKKQLLAKQLTNNSTLIITYGTAWVYELKSTKEVVNNCQKIPADAFKKRLLSTKEIIDSFKTLISELKVKPKEIIFTVSPVRHTKDGFHENQLSKSTLLLAINHICKGFDYCSYFPSYEIMMDDLRDYRFYADDLIHPNNQAIEYIWNFFSKTYFSEHTIQLNAEIRKLIQAVNHRAFQPKTEQHQKFLKNLIQKMEAFQTSNKIDFKAEIEYIGEQIL